MVFSNRFVTGVCQNKVVRPLASISFFVVGSTVFKLLFFVLEL